MVDSNIPISRGNFSSPPQQEKLLRQVKASRPGHVAIIMDGNGRWAKSRGLTRVLGHRRGVESVRAVVKTAVECGIDTLSLFAFSTENWGRPRQEISMIMNLIDRFVLKDREILKKQNIKLRVVGDLSRLPEKTAKNVLEAVDYLNANTGMILNVALSYSGRSDILKACQKIAQKISHGLLKPEEIDESIFANHLSTAELSEPDLLIRTSGEFRISNYMLWESAYSERYFKNVLCP